jgi:hypothetical protein
MEQLAVRSRRWNDELHGKNMSGKKMSGPFWGIMIVQWSGSL